MTTSRVLRAGVLASIPFIAACSLVLDTDRHRSDSVPVAASDFCAEFADLACTGERDCCSASTRDFDTCTRQVSSECVGNFGRYVLDPRTGYDARQAGVALAEARELVAACDPAIQMWLVFPPKPPTFPRVLTGTIPIGDACEESRLLDLPSFFTCEEDGICTQLGTVANPDWAFVRPAAQGDECNYDGVCEPGLQCTASIPFLTTGTCEERKPTGEPCARDAECITYLCNTVCRDATNEEAFCAAAD